MSNPEKICIFWFRRDLRFDDNHGLYEALKGPFPVLPVYIFDPGFLDLLPSRDDKRVLFIDEQLLDLKQELEKTGSSLLVVSGKPVEVFENLAERYSIAAVYTNTDYEPESIRRDKLVSDFLLGKGIPVKSYKDHVIFEKNEILTGAGRPYTVFTPYLRKWKSAFYLKDLDDFPSETLMYRFLKAPVFPMPDPEFLGFRRVSFRFPSRVIDPMVIKNYHITRDFPAIQGTSRLGIHLRFGTLSIRKLVRIAAALNDTWLNELIWREFFMQVLFHFPLVAHSAFRKEYDQVKWRNNEQEFEAWCNGNTGYAFVDAGMRELSQTGFMHNRARMVTASFLVKHLLIDWRWGEAWFAGKLLDHELASNNGNWQWVAGTGCDAAPYLRVFNPLIQVKKYDPAFEYVRRWVPEYGTAKYPVPLVEHTFARERFLLAYKLTNLK